LNGAVAPIFIAVLYSFDIIFILDNCVSGDQSERSGYHAFSK